MDRKTWEKVIKGWIPPKVTAQDDIQYLNLEEYWSKEKDEEDHGNSRALNTIFNRVDKNIFRFINTCSIAKEA